MELASSGGLVSIRESCLYFERRNGELRISSEVISREYSKELLLFALETYDDALIGLTQYSDTVGKKIDELFVELTNI